MHEKYSNLMDDNAVLAELGRRLARHRLNLNQTQAAIAREAGVAQRTLSKVENGHVVDSQSLVRILRALDLLDGLAALVPQPQVSPVALAQARGRVRERASGYRGDRTQDQPDAGEWTWPDEEQ